MSYPVWYTRRMIIETDMKNIKVNDRIQDRAAGHHGGVVVEIFGDLAVVQWDNAFSDKIVLGKVWLGLIEKVTR
jgi:23S rRNA G2069 N7-methylase RlmK/C1962 C5-methylase RlmI